MTIRLEVGKYYRDRYGRVWGPLDIDNHTLYPFFSPQGKTWAETGSYDLQAKLHPCDLIEEAHDQYQPQQEPSSRLASGLTLREHYAGLAMAALIVDPNSGGDIAKHAVRHADKLIAALKEQYE